MIGGVKKNAARSSTSVWETPHERLARFDELLDTFDDRFATSDGRPDHVLEHSLLLFVVCLFCFFAVLFCVFVLGQAVAFVP